MYYYIIGKEDKKIHVFHRPPKQFQAKGLFSKIKLELFQQMDTSKETTEILIWNYCVPSLRMNWVFISVNLTITIGSGEFKKLYSSFGKHMVSFLFKFKLCQIQLKMAQLFWSRLVKGVSVIFKHFVLSTLEQRVGPSF